jgi:hypothetical protein
MPQVFGSDQTGLIAEASLWSESGFLEDVEGHEKALAGAGFEHGAIPTYANKEGFHPRGDVWGQHLTSDNTHHTWAVARVQNPDVDPNSRQTAVGGAKPRYAVEIHKVPKNPQSTRARNAVTPIWEGNDINHFLEGRPGGGMGWPQVQKAMQRGPRK